MGNLDVEWVEPNEPPLRLRSSRAKSEMRAAPPETLSSDVRAALTAHISELEVLRLFPVQFREIDALGAAEPSKGALLRLDSGRLVVVEYGSVTSKLTVSVPQDADARQTLVDLLGEAPLDNIDWMSTDVDTCLRPGHLGATSRT
jgi:hypothetical protein